MPDEYNLTSIMKEPGVADLRPLGLKIISNFARAIKMEREAGHTTPEAMAKLDEAIVLIEALP